MKYETSEKSNLKKPEISRYALAMFDILGFSFWLKEEGTQAVLDSYHALIERAIVKPNEKGGLGTVQTPDGALLAVIRPPNYAYGSDTLLLWCPLMPPLVGDFVERCSDLMCGTIDGHSSKGSIGARRCCP